jgi:sugar lactone lactonase YvrE
MAVVVAILAVPAVAGGVGGFVSPLFGMTTAPNGDILVADAGDGIVAIRNGAIRPFATLPGVTDVSPIGRGSVWATTGAGESPQEDTGQGLYRASRGHTQLVANLFEFEAANNPDGVEPPDSNPYDVQSLGGRAALVADAGGNDLLRVDRHGNVEVLAVFPDELVSTANLQGLIGCPEPVDESLAFICDIPEMPAQAVPTSIAIGRDGSYYVGELKGFPAPSGESNIWRVAPGASWAECGVSPDCVKVFDGGFTSIIDLAFGPDGNLYVAELDEDSWAAVEFLGGGAGGTINSCNLHTLTCEVVETSIPMLTAITFGKDGSLWATTNALVPGAAEVIQVR